MLLIDIGNTCFKWAVSSEDKFVQKGIKCYQSAEITDLFDEVFSSVSVQKRIYISCVASENIKQKIECWFKKNWQVNSVFVVSQASQAGLFNAYNDAEKLGVDRWCAMIGAWVKYKKAFCIIDCGTAVTLDVVDNEGHHLGGLIMPGLTMMQAALSQGTAGISHGSGERLELAKKTTDAVNSGCYQLLSSGLEMMLNKHRLMLGNDLLCIVTGGDGAELSKQFKCDYIFEPDVILYGLQQAAITGL
ncbi:MAG: type III pantothenate kinase [Gammaproteobacteria bacterium]|nr:type III pantothenate kinase [Gammaproteobacteria bacterium]